MEEDYELLIFPDPEVDLSDRDEQTEVVFKSRHMTVDEFYDFIFKLYPLIIPTDSGEWPDEVNEFMRKLRIMVIKDPDKVIELPEKGVESTYTPSFVYHLVSNYRVESPQDPKKQKLISLQNLMSSKCYISDSTIPNGGKGLFALVDIKDGDDITDYGGVVGQQALNPDSVYVATHNNWVVDAERYFNLDQLGRWANDNIPDEPNAEIANYLTFPDKINPVNLYLKAVRDIDAGEEIFVRYGVTYWGETSPKKQRIKLCILCANVASWQNRRDPSKMYCSPCAKK